MTNWAIILGTLLATVPATGWAAPAPASASPPAAIAPDAGTLASAHQLMALTHVDSTVSGMFDKLMPLLVSSTVNALEASPESAQVVKAMVASRPTGRQRFVEIFRSEFERTGKTLTNQILDQTAREYATAFSKAELDEIIAFCSSGTGKKVVEMMPGLQEKMSQFGQQAGRTLGEVAGRNAMKRAIEELLPNKEHRS